MSKEESAIIAEKLSNKNALASAFEAKPYYKHFTLYFITILLLSSLALSAAFAFFLQQSTQTQGIINQQLKPLHNKFLQQSYLLEATRIINGILTEFNLQQLTDLHQEISVQQKKLLFIKSPHHSQYKKFFTDNNVANELITRLEENHSKNEQLRVQVATQVETLLDTINATRSEKTLNLKQKQLLLNAQQQLVEVLSMLQQLTEQSSVDDFASLRVGIGEVLSTDFPKRFASWGEENTNSVELVRGFIRLEDMLLNFGILNKWQAQLGLINDYKNRLQVQQVEMFVIIESLANITFAKGITNEQKFFDTEKLLAQSKPPRWFFIAFSILMIVIVVAVLMLWLRIKYSSKNNANYIHEALEAICCLEEKEVSIKTSKAKSTLYSEETYLLINKIQQINNSRYSENEYSTLAQKKQKLENQQCKDLDKIEQLTLALALVEYSAKAKTTSQLLLEQERCKALNIFAIRQLQLLGASAITSARQLTMACNTNEKENYLFRAHQQGRDLIRKLRQASCNRYLKTDDAVLTLSDVDFIALLQALLLNLSNKLSISNNHIAVAIDDKIQAQVNVDAEIFAEMFRIFIRLVFLEQKNCHLNLSVQLVDKNDGQQVICFTGQIESENSVVKLPKALQSFNDKIEPKNKLVDYFSTLLVYQHGEHINTNLTDRGYQLSFTLPLAVARANSQQSYPDMTLPKCLPDIESLVCNYKAQYAAMPIEVLLAVKSPIDYQRIQQLLQAIGLQVTFVVNDLMLVRYWQSGRFAVLMTEMPCTPYIDFKVAEVVNSDGKRALKRGVFSLDPLIQVKPDREGFSHWSHGQLDVHSSPEDLLVAMKPWIYERISVNLHSNYIANEQSRTLANEHYEQGTFAPAKNFQNQSFNFKRYIQHQGSIELAIFMLEEYTLENTQLMANLSHAFNGNHSDNAEAIIERLTVNSRILAAADLLKLCDDWKVLINVKGLDNRLQPQVALLKKTEYAVEAINSYVQTIT